VEGLRPWRPAAHDDAHRHGVSAALRPAHLPRGFVRIRQSGFLANTCRAPASRSRAPLSPPASPHATITRPRRSPHRDPRTWRVRAAARDDRRPDPLGAPAAPRSRSASIPHERPPSSDRRPRQRGAHVSGEVCLDPCAPVAPPLRRPPTQSGRRRSRADGLSIDRSTRDDPDSSSIAGRRASGFLQVSLSKVPRHPHQVRLGTRRRDTSDER
jgi:hypothetical protein